MKTTTEAALERAALAGLLGTVVPQGTADPLATVAPAPAAAARARARAAERLAPAPQAGRVEPLELAGPQAQEERLVPVGPLVRVEPLE